MTVIQHAPPASRGGGSLRAFRQARNSFMLKRDQKRVSKGSEGCQEEARRVKMRSQSGQKGSGGGQDEVKEAQKGVRRGSGGPSCIIC